MSTILEDIESKIEDLKTSTTKSNVGIVRETGDGVARIEGLSDVMLNEMIEFPNGIYGLALNLEETEVGAILMGDTTKVSEGDEVRTTGRLLSVPVGKALLGRVVNTLGQPLDDKGPVILSAGNNCAGRHQAPQRESAGANRDHANRRDDSHRSWSA